jgi:hypothetical protein
MRDSVQSNGMTTITKSEFSDDTFDEEEVQDEESAPDDGSQTFLNLPFLS